MKFYDLLGNDYVIGEIPVTVFSDVKLDSLLQQFFTKEQANNIVDILRQPLSGIGIKWRQELFVELENEGIVEFLVGVRKKLYGLQASFKTYARQSNPLYKPINLVDLFLEYTDFVSSVCNVTVLNTTSSSLLRDFISSFSEIQHSAEFLHLKSVTNAIKTELKNIKSLDLKIYTPTGSPRNAIIQQSIPLSVADELVELAKSLGIADAIPRRPRNEKVLTHNFIVGLSQLYPEFFAKLEKFHNDYNEKIDLGIFSYIEQISFYLNMKEIFSRLRERQIPLIMPHATNERKISIKDAYDISLLTKLKTGSDIVPNDIEFNQSYGFHIITGANSGGKTAYLRATAICQILFSAGAYVPANDAMMYPFHSIFSHFPADESQADVGRLKEETVRVTEILSKANAESLVLLNETFSSTNEELSLELSYELLAKLCELGAFGLYVTHNHNLLERAKTITGKTKVGHLIAVVLDDDTNSRTYKIVSANSATQSYAQSILDKYMLSRAHLVKRFPGVKLW